MEGLKDPNYVEMSLDDVIRDMKAKKAQEQQNVENNSPFLRQQGNFQFNRIPFRTAIQPRNFNRSNYLNHMAKKRIQRARKTLDLRHRLITIRADKDGLDLRWKIVANMIVKLRQQARMVQSKPKFHPYPQLEHPSGPQSGPNGHLSGMSPNPKLNRSTLSQVERLVGKLPSWMKATAASMIPRGTPLQPDFLRPTRFDAVSIRTGSRVFSPLISRCGMPMQQQNFAAPDHIHPCCHVNPPTVPNHYQTQRLPHVGEMPPLAYEPLPVAVKPTRLGVIKNIQSEEDIQISVVDIDEELPRVKQTLNERFTQ